MNLRFCCDKELQRCLEQPTKVLKEMRGSQGFPGRYGDLRFQATVMRIPRNPRLKFRVFSSRFRSAKSSQRPALFIVSFLTQKRVLPKTEEGIPLCQRKLGQMCESDC